jgi:uncharacterized protein (DUF2236 family)
VTGHDRLFAPDAVANSVHSEAVLLLGGGRALLMQLAHPAVASGVAEHSRFREHRFRRLLRTLRLTLAIIYGTREQALASARQVNTVHRSVVGQGYDATDPDLLLWVYATLIDTALLMHDRFVRVLSEAERETYYGEMGILAEALGVPRWRLPPDSAAFRGLCCADGRRAEGFGRGARDRFRAVPAGHRSATGDAVDAAPHGGAVAVTTVRAVRPALG